MRSTSNKEREYAARTNDAKTAGHAVTHGMADALKTQEQDPAARELSFLERLALLVDPQWNWRQNQALVRRLHLAKLCGNVYVSARPRPLRTSMPATT